MKFLKNPVNPNDVQRNLTFATTQHGYSIDDHFTGTPITPWQLTIAVGIAFILLFLTFFVQIANFWVGILLTSVVLGFLTLAWGDVHINRKHLSAVNILIAVASALALYLIFFLGKLLLAMLFPAVDEFTLSLYQLTSSLSPIVGGLLIFFIIAPVEELFWRGFVQHNMQAFLGRELGLVLASILYALAHVCSLNPLLVIAALFGGLFWGVLYQLRGNLFLVILSHAIWSVLIFAILPLA